MNAVTEPACGHQDRAKMPAARCVTVMAGHVPAIRSERLSRLMAGMSIWRTSMIEFPSK
jgi:hypothetical protein